MKLSMILARSMDNVIGINNDIPWKCPADMEKFREITSGPNKAVVMGRNTWDSLPKKPLPGRLNIIVTANPQNLEPFQCMEHIDQIAISPSIQDAIKYAESKGIEELIFIGGKGIYEEAVKIVDEVYLTEMEWNTLSDNVTGPNDKKVYFDYHFDYHTFNPDQSWDLIERYMHSEHDGDRLEDLFTFYHLKRK